MNDNYLKGKCELLDQFLAMKTPFGEAVDVSIKAIDKKRKTLLHPLVSGESLSYGKVEHIKVHAKRYNDQLEYLRSLL